MAFVVTSKRLLARARARLGDVTIDGELERLKEAIEAREERRLLIDARRGRDVCWEEADDEVEPLVTVRIATVGDPDLLIERAVRSVLAQTYERLEVVVVGDAAGGDTAEAVARLEDPRVRYYNLARRGPYPSDRYKRWRVGGSHPWNVAIALSAGAWIAPCDDDDEFTNDHVEVLLSQARARRLEMVYSVAAMQDADHTWSNVGSEPLMAGALSHGSVMYSAGLHFMRYSATCWKLPESNDWNLWKRMARIGVRIGFVDRLTYRHFHPPLRP